MADHPTSMFASDAPPGVETRRHTGLLSRWPLWRQLTARWSGEPRERSSAEVTTQIGTGRGHALRLAHLTLKAHLDRHAATRQVMPHLSVVERGLRKRGSRALFKLPMPVLRRALEQLAMLQGVDASPQDEQNLRVLRLRLMEALAIRGPRRHDPHDPASLPTDVYGMGSLQDAGLDVMDATPADYNEALRRQRRNRGASRH